VTIRGSVRSPRTAPNFGVAYQQSFVRDVHLLIWAGHARLEISSLANDEETVITEKLVIGMRTLIEGPRRARWAARFTVYEEAPLSGDSAHGKARRRIDILVERALAGPRPKFQFEAKRLYRSDSIAEYLGDDGLGCFVSGAYAIEHTAAGMLGYVQADTPSNWASKIAASLAKDRTRHGLAKKGDVWALVTFAGISAITYRSSHTRRSGPFSIDVFHTLLVCCSASGRD
jgi:hypothetical protein